MSAKKLDSGLYGERTTVLLCADFKPGKPKVQHLQAYLKPVSIKPTLYRQVVKAQGGNCLCHGKALGTNQAYQVFPNA